MRLDNQKIYDSYKKSVLAGKKQKVLTEATKGMRRRAQVLEDKVDDFFDEIEKKIQNLEETPVFQTKMLQMLSDATKEHNEFIMALKQICQTLDSGSKVIPNRHPHAFPKPNTVDRDLEQQNPEDQTGIEDDSMNQIDTPVTEQETYNGPPVPKGDSVPHIQKVYTGGFKVVGTPNGSAYYVMGLTSNDSEYVPVTSAFPSAQAANEFMAKLKTAETKQKQMVTNKWNKADLAKNIEYRPKEM